MIKNLMSYSVGLAVVMISKVIQITHFFLAKKTKVVSTLEPMIAIKPQSLQFQVSIH